MDMQERQALSVTQINLYIKNKFNQDDILTDVLIKGEISNFKAHSSGHMYMSLKDENSVMRAVMFRSSAAKLGFAPQNGMKVVARGRVSVYERDGQYQLYINSMQQEGTGDLHEAFEILKQKLNSEGLFDPAHKKKLPRYPKKIGVVTAPTGAAIRDIINVLSRRFAYSDIVIYPVLVQGENSARSITDAINYFDKSKTADVLIVGRGGGSIEDLWSFNEESVAYAIYNCSIPIISAVGHEIDFTISDFVADLRAPTPSAAAELVVPSSAELKEKFENVYNRLYSHAKRIVDSNRLRLKYNAESRSLKNPKSVIDENRVYLDRLTQDMISSVKIISERKRRLVQLEASKLNGLSPLATLGRGYSLTKNSSGDVICSTEQVEVGEEIEIVLNSGRIISNVKKIINKGE